MSASLSQPVPLPEPLYPVGQPHPGRGPDPGQRALGAHGLALAAVPPRTRARLLACAPDCSGARLTRSSPVAYPASAVASIKGFVYARGADLARPIEVTSLEWVTVAVPRPRPRIRRQLRVPVKNRWTPCRHLLGSQANGGTMREGFARAAPC